MNDFRGYNSERLTQVLRIMAWDHGQGISGIMINNKVVREPGKPWPSFYCYVMDSGLKIESGVAETFDKLNPDPSIDPERPSKPWYKVRPYNNRDKWIQPINP
jgi:hypothetical protein